MIRRSTSPPSRQEGSFLVLGLLMSLVLLGFVAAQSTLTTKNALQSRFFTSRAELFRFAESGAEIAYHDLENAFTAAEGNLGTSGWDPIDDYGEDGTPGTGDKGENDGIPTPGEPNVNLLPIGDTQQGTGICAFVDSATFPGVHRVFCTATNGEDMVTVEKVIRETPVQIPLTGALFVAPTVALDLKGNSFLIDGNDHNPDGTPGPGPALPGITTSEGAVAGDNAADILAQISAGEADQVIGLGGDPSVGEMPDVDFGSIFSSLNGVVTSELAPGTYANPTLGDYDADDLPITRVTGDLTLSGNGSGAGILLVDGSLTITGQFNFKGIIIVSGDMILTGGGAGVHVYGSTMIGQTFTAIDPNEVTLAGTADLFYSSEVIGKVQQSLAPNLDFVFYREE